MICKCNQIFTKFQWADLASLNPKQIPKNKGVYVIRVRKRGKAVEEAISRVEAFLSETNWYPFMEHVSDRINRLKNIGSCPVIYIGAAPSTKTGLRGRYVDLCGRRHTVFFPILTLLLAEWGLDFGWFETEQPKRYEERLKRLYLEIHGSLPALVKR